mmetsp:Transcript_28844/g.32986  ORF Transcript_28844/g.32986 Transcript_28844/m.32986 type:complete len:520 (+) Transcript_28844:75-1634(+)
MATSSESEKNNVIQDLSAPPVDSTTPLSPSNDDKVNLIPMQKKWSPSGSTWRDLLHFVGPGWFVSIAYVDPGNYQADIQAGAASRYELLWVIWWTSILSIYVQILCVRLAYYANMTLAEAQAKHSSKCMRYLNWFIAEFSIVITDLPEVIGIGIACNIFFGWPYYVGVIASLFTTMVFLFTMNFGMRVLETIIVLFVGIMSVSLFIELDFIGVSKDEIVSGWIYGFTEIGKQNIFAMTGVLGAVVMPHNLYLHTAACQARPAEKEHIKQAVRFSSWEPVLPILISFFVNLAIVAIAAEKVHGQENSSMVGLTDFCEYFKSLKAGCILWGIALLAAGQSSAITTTYTGQYVMDGFLQIQLPVHIRAIVTRLVAIAPCVLVSIAFPNKLNELVNIVNSLLAFFLPFAFTPLVKYNCSPEIMGKDSCAKGIEKYILYGFAFAVWAINAFGLSLQNGGFFGDLRPRLNNAGLQTLMGAVEILVHVFYIWWNLNCVTTPIARHSAISTIDTDEGAISTEDIDLL